LLYRTPYRGRHPTRCAGRIVRRGSPALAGIFGAHRLHESSSPKSVTPSTARSRPANAATLFALVKEEGVFNTRVRLTGEAPKGDDAVARRGNDRDGARNRDYVHNYTTDDDADAANAQQQRGYQTRGRETQYYYRERPYYYRPYYGRGLFFPFGR
jgi:hypothetical protein